MIEGVFRPTCRVTAKAFSWFSPARSKGYTKKVSIDIEIRSARPEPPEYPVPLKQPPTRLLLIRHGQSTWNQEHRIQGQLDPPLSADGHAQARLLARRLAGRQFAGFYSSDLARAMETAQDISDDLGAEPTPDRSLREIFLGDWEGLRTAEIEKRFPTAWEQWTQKPDWDLVPGGEGAGPFESRVGGAIDAIANRHAGGEVLVVTHGGVIQVAVHRIVGRSPHGLFPFKIQNASITTIEKRDGRFVIAGVNDVAHLEKALVADPGPG